MGAQTLENEEQTWAHHIVCTMDIAKIHGTKKRLSTAIVRRWPILFVLIVKGRQMGDCKNTQYHAFNEWSCPCPSA